MFTCYKRILFPKELKNGEIAPHTRAFHLISDDIFSVLYIFLNFVLLLSQLNTFSTGLILKNSQVRLKFLLSAYLMICIIVLIKLSL